MGKHPKLVQYKLSQEFYHPIHGWLAMLVCVLGTLFNLANILVLTHRDMRSPVNMILTGIAVADFLVMLEYIPFTIYMNLLDTENRSPEEEVTKISHSSLLLLSSVFSRMGNLHGVPHQLHSDDPHSGHLAHLLPRHLEVHHDQVPLRGGHPLHGGQMQDCPRPWLWSVFPSC